MSGVASFDKTYKLSGPEYRGASKEADGYLNRSIPVFVRKTGVLCPQASLVNAIAILSGTEVGREVLNLPLFGIRSIASATAWLEKNVKHYTMQKVPCHNFVSKSLREFMLGQNSRMFWRD